MIAVRATDWWRSFYKATMSANWPHMTAINTVFQDYALFPHECAGEHRVRAEGQKVGKTERRKRALEMLQAVRLADYGVAVPISSVVVSVSASLWREHWSITRRSCCSTSHSARSI